MKKLYEFTIKKEQEVVEEEVVHEDDGTTTTRSKKVKDLVPFDFFVKKPTHSMLDEASLYYGVELAKAVKAGMLTESMLKKRFENDGGVLSKSEIKSYEALYDELKGIMEELGKVEAGNKKKKETKAQKSKKDSLQKSRDDILEQIQEFEVQKTALFNQTAEYRAKNKVILWWVINLAYQSIGGEDSLIWGDEEIEDRIESYYQWEADDETPDMFKTEVKLKFLYYVSFWFNTNTSDPKAFEEVAKRADEDIERELSDISQVEY